MTKSFDLNQANGDVNNGSVGYFNKAFVHDVTPTNDVKIPIDTKVTHATANGSVKRKQTRSHGESVTLEEENWDVVELEDTTTPWKELDTKGRVLRVLSYVGRAVLVLTLIYFFICSIGVLSAAFQLVGGRAAGSLFAENEILSNPVCELMLGVLVTVLVQSSSTSTSIIVTMVAAGILDVHSAIPIVMGANIGTSVTNTLVAVGQVNDRNQFRRAFAGATVHDMFNWATVIILLPLEIIIDSITGNGGYLYQLSKALVDAIPLPEGDSEEVQFLDAITDPFTSLIVQVDKDVIEYIAAGDEREKRPLLKYWCDDVEGDFSETGYPTVAQSKIDQVEADTFSYNINLTSFNDSTEEYQTLTWTNVIDNVSTKCEYLFVGQGLPGSTLSEEVVGVILMITSLAVLCLCLVLLVKTLGSLMRGSMAKIIMKVINWEFKSGIFRTIGLTGYVAILVGAGITVLVQSSSVFTSTLTPLVGLGVITVERMYPLTLGSNIGTTITSLLAALSSATNIEYTLQISFVHLFFNITGIVMFYPVPFMRQLPIKGAKKLGHITADYRWFAAVYIVFIFFLIPGLIFALSVPGWEVLAAVGIPILLLIIVVIIINVLQDKKPHRLPAKLRNWDFLPMPFHSLEPWDGIFRKCGGVCKCCPCCKEDEEADEYPQPSKTEILNTKSEDNGIAVISDNRL